MNQKLLLILFLMNVQYTFSQSFLKLRLEYMGRNSENKIVFVRYNVYTGLDLEKKIGFDKSLSSGIFYRGYYLASSFGTAYKGGSFYSSDFITYARDFHGNDKLTKDDVYSGGNSMIDFHYLSFPVAFRFYITSYFSLQYRASVSYLVNTPKIKGDSYATPLEFNRPNRIIADNSLVAAFTLFGRLDCMLGYTYSFNRLIQKHSYTYSYMQLMTIRPNHLFVGVSIGLLKLKTKSI